MNMIPSQREAFERRVIWNRGKPIPGHDPAQWRRDYANRAMLYSAYGDRSSSYGWEYGHVVPAALGGTDDIGNLRPENWATNAGQAAVIRALRR